MNTHSQAPPRVSIEKGRKWIRAAFFDGPPRQAGYIEMVEIGHLIYE